MGRFFSSLRVRALLIIVLAIVPPAGLLLHAALEHRRGDVAGVQENALRLARVAAATQEQLIQGARQLLFALVQLPPVRTGAACSGLFAELLKQYPLYANLGASRPNGDVFCSAVPLTQPVNVADTVWFQWAVRSRSVAMGGYQIGRITGMPVLVVGAPVLDPGGRVLAVVFAALDLKWLNILAVEARLPEGAALAVIDRQGTILARHPDPEQWVGKRVPGASVINAIVTQGEGTIEETGVDGVRRLYAFTPLGSAPEPGAYVKIGIPKAAALARANRILARNLLGLGVVAVLALTVAWAGAHVLLVRPVKSLVQAAERLGAGDLTVRTGLPHGSEELTQLARAFDEMAAALERREAERERSEEELRVSREQIRALAAHLQSVREEERTWIAREIHDHLGQALTGLKMDLAWLERRLPEDQTVLREKTQAMARLIDTTTQSVRQLSTALRPGLLDDLGLLAALDWLARDFQSRTGIHCECVSALEEDPVGREPATHLFRIVQEALTNIARHANATAVTIRLAEDAGWVVLVVQDDGKGITEQEMTSARGLGLVGIRERALLLGGEVIFTGVPGRGTTVTVKVPRHRGEAGGS